MSRGAAVRTASLSVLCGAIVVSGCARAPISLPTGAGTPATAEASAAYAQAAAECRGVRTMTASLSLSGRAGDTKLRGRIDAGLAENGQLRLEWVPPVSFGRPFFVLVSPEGEAGNATLVLPRDKRVITDGSTEQIIQAFTGLALTPDELRTILAGCGLVAGEPVSGRAFDEGWIAVDLGDSTSWLRQIDGTWRMQAAVRGPLQVRYDEFASFYPAQIRLRTSSSTGAGPADITVRLSGVELNVPLGPEVFRVSIPEDAVPMTMDELREALRSTVGNR